MGSRSGDGQSAKVTAVRAFCQAHPQAVLYDEPGEALFDVFAVKTLPLKAGALEWVEARADRFTKDPYVALGLGDGRTLALTVSGIGFPPDFRSTGPLKALSEVVCFRDYRSFLDRLKHDLYGHPDQPPTRATVDLLLMCIAIVDGARRAGFDVGREERELEQHLEELEKRAPPPKSP